MNQVTIIGRIVRDIDLKFLPNSETAVAKFTIATDRKVGKGKEKQADFIPIVIFGATAEFVASRSAKGKLIAIHGRIQTSSYEKKDGTKVYTTDVIAEDVQILEWAEKNEGFKDMTPIDNGSIPF